jgi:TPR repeat protein
MARLGHDQFMQEDKVKALMWFLLAAENGDEDAQFALQMFGRWLTDHEAQLARELADRCRQTSYQGC